MPETPSEVQEAINTSDEHFLVYLVAFTITMKSDIIADIGIQLCSIFRPVLHLEEFNWKHDWIDNKIVKNVKKNSKSIF